MLAQHWPNQYHFLQAWAITGPAVKPAVGQYQNANIGPIFQRILAQSWPNVPMLPGTEPSHNKNEGGHIQQLEKVLEDGWQVWKQILRDDSGPIFSLRIHM